MAADLRSLSFCCFGEVAGHSKKGEIQFFVDGHIIESVGLRGFLFLETKGAIILCLSVPLSWKKFRYSLILYYYSFELSILETCIQQKADVRSHKVDIATRLLENSIT